MVKDKYKRKGIGEVVNKSPCYTRVHLAFGNWWVAGGEK
jgi:hypothetical protein